MSRTVSRTREILTILILAIAFRAVFGDAIAGVLDGIYIGLTDNI